MQRYSIKQVLFTHNPTSHLSTLVAFHVTPLVDGTQQCSCLERTNHCYCC